MVLFTVVLNNITINLLYFNNSRAQKNRCCQRFNIHHTINKGLNIGVSLHLCKVILHILHGLYNTGLLLVCNAAATTEAKTACNSIAASV